MSPNSDLSRLEKKLNYTFSDKNLLKISLTHKSKSKNNNERLEFLGDALLETIISKELYETKPDSSEGDLTRLRSTMVRGSTLAILANILDLKDFVIVGSGELRTGGYQRESTLADTFEAIVAAIYLDSNNFTTVETVVLEIYKSQLSNLPEANKLKDSKTKLQEYLQANGDSIPEYNLIQITGSDHKKSFEVSCTTNNEITNAKGSSRKKAEQSSAKKMLEIIDKIKVENNE